MPNDLLKFYFSFKGRATRYDFNIRYALIAFVLLIVGYGLDYWHLGGEVYGLSGNVPLSAMTFSNIANVIATISGFAVISRRLHDFGYSGWWQIPVYIVLVAISIFAPQTAVVDDPNLSTQDILAAVGIGSLLIKLASLILCLIFFSFLSARRGTIGPNKYGPDLLKTETVETVQ